jgi:hypothetical protein
METSYKPTRVKGVYKTSAGTYRVRKQVNGRKVSKNFTKFKKALEFKKQINGGN